MDLCFFLFGIRSTELFLVGAEFLLDLLFVGRVEDCREFAVTSGVAACVMRRFQAEGVNARTLPINGLDKKTVRLMKTWERRAPEAELVEVMACEGGCIAGPGTIVKPALALKLRSQKMAPVKSK